MSYSVRYKELDFSAEIIENTASRILDLITTYTASKQKIIGITLSYSRVNELYRTSSIFQPVQQKINTNMHMVGTYMGIEIYEASIQFPSTTFIMVLEEKIIEIPF